MDDFSLIVNLPEVFDEKMAKELRSSLENLLNDYFTAFSEIATGLHKRYPVFQCGTSIEFENGKTFQILFTQRFDKNAISVGMVNDYGICDKIMDYEDAVIINKYALEMSTRIHDQRIAASTDIFKGPAQVEGIYSMPASGDTKMPIYKSRDNNYNFVDGPGRVTMNHKK